MSHATFFLSTGRCGTQWLAANLSRVYGEKRRVVHEPLQTEYQPRRMLAANAGAMVEPSPSAQAHVEEVIRSLLEKPYIECGYPCWSSLPWIAPLLEGRMRVVHLVRDPRATARSWVARGAHIPPMLPHMKERELISPFDEGSAFAEYRVAWPALLPYEKCLVYWAEVNAFAQRWQKDFNDPWLTLHYEELFQPKGVAVLLEFLELTPDDSFFQALGTREDQYRSLLAESSCDPRLLDRHPRIMELAHALGYRS